MEIKSKEQQIEEITNIIENEYKKWLNVTGVIPVGTTYYAECMGVAKDSAEAIFKAGYQKLFTGSLASDMQNAFTEGFNQGMKTKMAYDYVKFAQKYAVKDFAHKIKSKAVQEGEYEDYVCHLIDLIDRLLEEYEIKR